MKRGEVLRAWLPLEAAWLLMAIEGPFIAAVVARLADPTLNLAAFGVAFPLGMLFESPIILIMSASTALVADRESLHRLFRFTTALNGAITLALAVCVVPPVFAALSMGLMGLPEAVAVKAHVALALLLPWPAAIGFRRFYQGLLIRAGKTRFVAYCTAIRLVGMGGTALLLALPGRWPGAWVGCAALSVGVTVEAVAARLWAAGCLRDLKGRTPAENSAPLTYRAIAHFYVPLAMTSVLTLGVNPLVSFFLGRARMPLESLAVMPVVNSFVFIFNTAGLTFQEVAIPLFDRGERAHAALRHFAWTLALVASGLLLLVALSPLSRLWFQGVAGLSPLLAAFAATPAAILGLLPALTVLVCYQRAALVVARTTRPITWATVLEVGGIAAVLLLLTQGFGLVGVLGAACALVAGRAASGLYLMPRLRQLGRASTPA